MKEIKIIDYRKEYAAGLADMWNKSADSWGGKTSVATADSILQEIEESANLRTWLALAGDEVVGFCCFSEYKDDEGAGYIPLLNVRPDFQGRKVGKLLVLNAVKTACQHPWPRLDLYTWPGNTRAMPLYKKCGFFWEDRDDSTHLMNFIPHVMKTEAVVDYFREADWYDDSVREIDLEPDGRKDNGFDYYEYRWEHANGSLRMEFERRGRGLRLIETDDWLVSATVPAQELAFGRSYAIKYRLLNKSGKPLRVSIRGRDDKNIVFSFEKEVTVQGEQEICHEFYVDQITEEQSVWLTHPSVTSELLINGKRALYKVGIVPKYPLLIGAVVPEQEYVAATSGEFYLNLENGYSEPAEFSFKLPESDFIDLDTEGFDLELSGGEKRAVPVQYLLHRTGLLQGKIEITAKPWGGSPVQFSTELIAPFAGRESRFGGETDKGHFIINGRTGCMLGKFTNTLMVYSLARDYYKAYFFQPQIGLPYSVEFAKARAAEVEWGEERGAVCLRAKYLSTSKPGIVIERIIRLDANGLLSQEWILANEGEDSVAGLWFRTHMDLDNPWLVLPRGDGVIEERDYGSYLGTYTLKDLQENWLYSHTGNRGLCWPKELTLKGNDWVWIEERLGTLAPGQQVKLKPIFMAMGTFAGWEKFRDFALGNMIGQEISPADSLEVVINGGNPFIFGNYRIDVCQHRNKTFDAQVVVYSTKGSFLPCKAAAVGNSVGMKMDPPAIAATEVLNIDIGTPGVDYQRQAIALGCGGREIEKQHQQAGLPVMTVDNGILSFSAAPAFGPVIFSLQCRGLEWMDSSFPTPAPKSWWSPWLGGLGFMLKDLSEKSLLRQPREICFARFQDRWGNQWQGLEIQVRVEEHEKYQGLLVRQRVLTLPGLAGISTFLSLEHSGLALNAVDCWNGAFLSPGSSGGRIEFLSPWGYRVCFKQSEENEIPDVRKVLISGDGPQSILLFSTADLNGYINRDVLRCGSWQLRNLLPGQGIDLPPQFYLFVDEDIPEAALEPLAGLRHLSPVGGRIAARDR